MLHIWFNVHEIFVCDKTLHTFCTKVNLDRLLFVICGTLCDGVRAHRWIDFLHTCFLSTSVLVWPHWSKLEVPKVGEYAITIRPQIHKQRCEKQKKDFWFRLTVKKKKNPHHSKDSLAVVAFQIFFFFPPSSFNIQSSAMSRISLSTQRCSAVCGERNERVKEWQWRTPRVSLWTLRRLNDPPLHLFWLRKWDSGGVHVAHMIYSCVVSQWPAGDRTKSCCRWGWQRRRLDLNTYISDCARRLVGAGGAF